MMEDTESLSDHLYISFKVKMSRNSLPRNKTRMRRWNLRKFNKDLFEATLIWQGKELVIEDQDNLSQIINKLDKLMEEACDVVTPRIGPVKPRRQAYWWTDNVVALRFECIQARRKWQRAKKRKLPREHTELENTYKVKRKDRAAIIKAKAQAWQELIDSVNRNPWGLPYKLVLGKLKLAAQALT